MDVLVIIVINVHFCSIYSRSDIVGISEAHDRLLKNTKSLTHSNIVNKRYDLISHPITRTYQGISNECYIRNRKHSYFGVNPNG